jgi:hypothetical protein
MMKKYRRFPTTEEILEVNPIKSDWGTIIHLSREDATAIEQIEKFTWYDEVNKMKRATDETKAILNKYPEFVALNDCDTLTLVCDEDKANDPK